MIINVILLVLWTLVGVINLTSEKISKVNYFLAWTLLMMQFISNILGAYFGG